MSKFKDSGTLANRPANPQVGWEYTATDTNQKFTCFADGVWTEDSAATADVLPWKKTAKLATTGNITLSGNQTIDGILTVNGDRVLVKDQSSPADNGIYVADAGAWARSTDADADAEVTDGMTVLVGQGTVNADTEWRLTTNDPITVGVTALTFVQNLINFGRDYQSASSTGRSTTTLSAFQTKVGLTTPANLNGTYRVGWSCAVDNGGDLGEVRLQNTTDAVTEDGPRIYTAVNSAERKTESGWAEVTFSGTAKTFEIQWRDQAGGNTQGIEFARLEFYRVS